jgi:hypothetical protein
MLCSVLTAVICVRSAYCDVSMPPEGLREFLPRLIPVCLTSNENKCTVEMVTDSMFYISPLDFVIQHGIC